MNKTVVVVLIIFIFVMIIPVIFGYLFQTDERIFGGLIFNPIDGYTYLAKMQIGYSGNWMFVLPFTAQPGSGGYIFLFYIFLGHVARVTGISNIGIFHISRILFSVLLIFQLDRFMRSYIPGKFTSIFFFWMVFGSGLGWIPLLGGYLSADTWVAEAFPFLSSVSNPHFPLSLVLMLEILLQYRTQTNKGKIYLLWCLTLAFLLGNILPFGFVVLTLVIFGDTIWKYIAKESVDFYFILIYLIGGLPIIVYQYWLTQSVPSLMIWNIQNITYSPPFWDFFISFSPAFIFALFVFKIKDQVIKNPSLRVLVLWLVFASVLAYMPLNLQRRFLLGFYIPTISLAAYYFSNIGKSEKWKRIIPKIAFPCSVITNCIVLLILFAGIVFRAEPIFSSRDEVDIISWIKTNTPSDSIILAPADLGIMIPAMTGRRVVYGHPFETVDAVQVKSKVDNYYTSSFNPENAKELFSNYGVSFVIDTTEETRLTQLTSLLGLRIIYSNSKFSLASVK